MDCRILMSAVLLGFLIFDGTTGNEMSIDVKTELSSKMANSTVKNLNRKAKETVKYKMETLHKRASDTQKITEDFLTTKEGELRKKYESTVKVLGGEQIYHQCVKASGLKDFSHHIQQRVVNCTEFQLNIGTVHFNEFSDKIEALSAQEHLHLLMKHKSIEECKESFRKSASKVILNGCLDSIVSEIKTELKPESNYILTKFERQTAALENEILLCRLTQGDKDLFENISRNSTESISECIDINLRVMVKSRRS